MSISRMIRWGGLAGALGGALWVAMLALYATLPVAHPGDHRRGGENLVILSAPLINVGILALHGHQRRRAGRFGRLAVAICGGGAVLVTAARVTVDVGIAPAAVFVASFALFFAGLLMLGTSALLAGEVPGPAAALLLASTLVLLAANFEDGRIWAAVPFGLAWAWVGLAVWRGRRWSLRTPTAGAECAVAAPAPSW